MIPKRVGGHGPTNAKIVIVGEAPGAEEDQSGIPFSGSAGKLLDSILMEAGGNRHDCYVTNVVKVRPPDNKLDRLSELGLTVEQFYPELYEEINNVNPTVIIALGATPLTALCGIEGITKYRGSILEGYPEIAKRTVIPAIHPAACLRTWVWTHLLRFDLRRAVRRAANPNVPTNPRVCYIDPTFEKAVEWLDSLQGKEYLSVDLETYMRSGLIRMIALTDSKDYAYCIPFLRNAAPLWSRQEEIELWRRILLLLLNKDVKVIAQNAQFEMTQLAPYTGGRLRVWMDTLRAHAIVYPELPHSLAFMTSIYTDVPYYKDDGKISKDKGWDFAKLQAYNCKDAMVTLEIAHRLEGELTECKLDTFYHTFDNPLAHTLWRMQTYGVEIDEAKRYESHLRLEEQIKQLTELQVAEVGYAVNPKSPLQMRKFLYSKTEGLGLPAKYKPKTNALTTDESALTSLYAQTNHPAIKLLLEIRRLRTLKETFLEMKKSPDGRIRTSYGVTETGRLSSSQDLFGVGANLQNIPKTKGAWIRAIFVPRHGKQWIKADLKQADARSVAWYARDPNLIRIFESGGDIHKQVAAIIFRTTAALVTKEQREIAKRCVHALNYDMQPPKFSKTAGLTLADAKRYYTEYHAAFPNIKSVFHAEVQSSLRRNRRLTNAYGRSRLFMGRWGEELFREAYAHLPQSNTADCIDSALPEIDEALPEDCRLLIQVHDELNVEAPESKVQECITILRHFIERPVMIHNKAMVIPLDIAVGPNWFETKEVA